MGGWGWGASERERERETSAILRGFSPNILHGINFKYTVSQHGAALCVK